jgi:hypothetical protein
VFPIIEIGSVMLKTTCHLVSPIPAKNHKTTVVKNT